MKRKALLLIIPFAAAGLAGCQQANPNPPGPTPDPQCESATVSIKSAGDVTTIKPTATLQLTAEVNISGCTFSWSSSDPTIATVDANGLVTGVKAGDVVIHYGTGSFNLKVDDDAPTPPVVSGLKEAYEAGFEKTSGATDPMTFSATVVAIRNCSGEYFIQDGEYGIDLYHPAEADVPKLVIGKKVKVTAALCNYKGLVETSGDIKVEADGDGVVPQPANVASKAALDALKTNVLANAEGVVVKKEVNTKNNDTTLTIAIAGENVPVFFKGGIVNDYTTFLNAATEGVTVVLNKVVVGDRDGRQLIIVDGSELTAGQPTPTKEVKSLAIAGTATKTVYEEGETYSAAGLSVVATYIDDTTETVTVAITPNKEKAALGDTSVTFSATFGGKTATKDVDVTVNEKPAPTGEITVDKEYSVGLAALGLDQKENGYYEGTNNGFSYKDIGTYNKPSMQFKSKSGTVSNIIPFSKTITKVTVKISKEAGNDATLDFCFGATAALGETIVLGSGTSYPINAKGTFDVTPSAGAKYFSLASTNFASYVEELLFNFEGSEPQKELTTLTVKTQPSKLAYNEGESFNAAGLVLHAVYSDSSEEDITSGWTISPAGALAPTDNKVTVSYGGKSVDVDITVTARELQSIAISGVMSDKKYVEGENWDASGLVVMGTYNIGDPAEIDSSKYNLTFNPVAPALGVTSVSIVASMKDGSITSEAHVETGITVTEAPVIVDFVKATSIAVGDTITFVNEENKKEMSGMASTGKFIDVAGYEDKIAHECTLSVEAGSQANTFAFKLGDNYLSYTGSNNEIYANATEVDDAASWTVSFDENGNAVITNVKTTERVIRYNAGSPRFACYKGTQEAIQVFKAPSAPVDPAVNSVTVSPKTASIVIGETKQLSAAVSAVGGAAETVSWSSDKEDVATVDANGLITAKAEGTAVITAASTVEGFTNVKDTATITVTTTPAPKTLLRIEASDYTETIGVGETYSFDGVVTAYYSDETHEVVDGALYQVTTNISTATAGEKTGVITLTGTETTCNFTVTVIEGTYYGTKESPISVGAALSIISEECPNDKDVTSEQIYCEGIVKSIGTPGSFHKNVVVTDAEGGNEVLIYTLNAESPCTIDEVVVGSTIRFHGYAKNFGGTLEFATANNQYVCAYSAVIPTVDVESVSFNDGEEVTIAINETKTLAVTVLPANATNKSVLYSVVNGDSNVELNTTTGAVTGKAKGDAVIKATTVDGGFEATITVHVNADAPATVKYTLTLNSTNITQTYQTGKDVVVDAVDSSGNTFAVTLNMTDVMKSTGNQIQIKKSSGFMYCKTDLGTIESVLVNNCTNGKLTAFYGTNELSSRMTTGTTEPGKYGYFNVSNVSSNVDYCDSIVIVFYK